MRGLAAVVASCFGLVLFALPVSQPHAQPSQADAPPLRELTNDTAKRRYRVETSLPSWVMPLPSQATANLPKTGYVFADSQARQDAAKLASYFVHRRVRIDTQGALGEFGQFSTGFAPEYQFLRMHRLRIHRDGKENDVLPNAIPRFLQRELGLEQSIYTGTITVSMQVPDLRIGDELEYAYSLEGSNPVFGEAFYQTVNWIDSRPIAFRRAVIQHPALDTLALRWNRPTANTPLEPRKATHRNENIWVFEEKDVASFEDEGYYPRYFDPVTHITVQNRQQWPDVAHWASGLIPTLTAPAGTQEIINQAKKESSLDKRALLLLGFVQREIRYVSLSIGESSHRPAEPGLTLERRFGDCKDKTVLYLALARAAGLDAYPVLMNLRRGRGAAQDLPSPLAFDHMLVGVTIGGKDFLLDPTAAPYTGSLEALQEYFHSAEVLPARSADRRGLVTIDSKMKRATKLVDQITAKSLTEPAVLKRVSHIKGPSASMVRMMYDTLPKNILEQGNLADIQQRYPNAKILSGPTATSIGQDEAAIETTYEIPDFLKSNEGSYGIGFLAPFLQGAVAVPPNDKRKAPVGIFSYPLHSEYEIEIVLPENVSSIVDPTSERVSNDWFDIEASSQFRGNRVVGAQKMLIKRDEVEADKVSLFRAEVQKLRKLPVFATFSKSNILDLNSTGSIASRIRAQSKDRVEKIDNLLKDGKLKGDDLAESLADRASAKRIFGDAKGADADLAEALKLGPNVAHAHSTAGEVAFARGEVAESVTHFGRAVRLDGDPEHFYRRGISQYLMGRWNEAIQDLTTSAQKRKGGASDFARLWLIWSYRAAGRELPDDLHAYVDKPESKEWPKSALLLSAGKISEQEMYASIDRLKGDEKSYALSEGDYYAGQVRLLKKDTAGAIEKFKATLAHGVLYYIEHDAAKISLKALGVEPPADPK